MKSIAELFIFILFIFALTACQSLKDYVSDKPENPVVEPHAAKYSDTPQMSVPSNRQYRKMTRSKMEDEADLHSQAGSMWVMEGQNSYLFAQNKTRREGDLLNVKLDGPALKQVETKVSVIKKLLKQLEEQQNPDPAAGNLAAAGADGARAPAAEKKPEPAKKEDENELKDVQNIQTRIVEKMADGNYRVKGAQPFMIGKREYKVIVQGMIRPEDYNDEGVSSQKLLDPQFDVVSIRRNKANEQGLVSKE